MVLHSARANSHSLIRTNERMTSSEIFYVIITNMISRFLRKELETVLRGLYPDRSGVFFAVSPEKRFGDYTTNAALMVSGQGVNAREAADEIVAELKKSDEFTSQISKTEVAGPGFINFYISDSAMEKEIAALSEVKKLPILSGKKINIEFVSANPTGELHIGHGRGAFYGDVLANIFEFADAGVSREYYINDSRESNQIKELGKTALGKGEQYKTTKLVALLEQTDFSGLDEAEAGYKLAAAVQEYNRHFLENKLNVRFDKWYSEDEKLRASLLNERTLMALKAKECTYDKDGAVWIKTSTYGDDEDRVVVRSDGSPSYFLSDISYHSDKFGRGYDSVIDIWGADHHGHVKRMQAIKKMLGWAGEFKIFITQLVSLKENGVSSKMSKRAGNVVLLEDLVDEFGLDVVRWFFLEKTLNTHIEFDMALAREHSAKNPVFYVQYAHARICSILEKAKNAAADSATIQSVLAKPTGRALAVKIIEFADVIQNIVAEYQVHKLTSYSYELATAFSEFYENVRVIEDGKYNSGAMTLAQVAQKILARSLGLLGISSPEKM